jgi:hypothetical protein
MPNLRVITDNAIDRATLTASTAAAGFPVSNLALQRKSDVWRATGTTARLSASWATPETVQAVALPYANLSPTTVKRVRVTTEAQMTNLLVAVTDFTNAAWTKTSVSLAGGIAGPDGTNSACTVTATAAGATITQTVSVTPANFVSSFYVRRRTGTGSVSIRNAANNGWIAVAVSSAWSRVSNDGGVTGATTSASLQLSSSGDAIDIAFPQLEAGSSATSYYAGTRPLGYIDSWQSYSYDSGNFLCCPAPAVSLRGFTAAQAASAYAFGGGAAARHWMPAAKQAYGLAVDIVDVNNLQGYIEAAHLVAGPMWEAATNFDYNASSQLVDSSKNERNDAGDLITDAGTVSRKVSIPMSKLSPADRATLWGILRAGGSRYPTYLSMFPEDADTALERDHQVYGKLVQLPAMALPFFKLASATIEVDSI